MKLQFANIFLDWKELFRPGSFNEFDCLVNFPLNKVFEKTVSWEKALFLSELCRLAYIKNEQLRAQILERFGMIEEFGCAKKGCQLFWLSFTDQSNPLKICCFRGTDDVFDYKHIFTVGKHNCANGGKIYRGFFQSFSDIEQTIKEIGKKYADENVWLVGHSLGGVLALLSSRFFKHFELNVFGIPKVGDFKFNQNFEGKTVNYFHLDGDFIAYLPFDKDFIPLKYRTIPHVKHKNKTCPTLLYAHAPISYSLNISLQIPNSKFQDSTQQNKTDKTNLLDTLHPHR